LRLIADRQTQKVQGLFGKRAAETGLMKPMHQIVRVGRWLQPGEAEKVSGANGTQSGTEI